MGAVTDGRLISHASAAVADKNTGHHDNDQRHDAHRVQLFEQQPKPAANAATPQQCMEQEDGRTTQYRDHVDPGSAE